MNKILTILICIAITGSVVYAAEPVPAQSIPDDPEAAGQMLLQQSYQKTDMTEEEAKLKKKEFEAKEKAELKELRAIEKIQKKKDKLQAKADKKRQKAKEYEKKIQYRLKKMEEKKKELETLVDPDAAPAENASPQEKSVDKDTAPQPVETQENSSDSTQDNSPNNNENPQAENHEAQM